MKQLKENFDVNFFKLSNDFHINSHKEFNENILCHA